MCGNLDLTFFSTREDLSFHIKCSSALCGPCSVFEKPSMNDSTYPGLDAIYRLSSLQTKLIDNGEFSPDL